MAKPTAAMAGGFQARPFWELHRHGEGAETAGAVGAAVDRWLLEALPRSKGEGEGRPF